MNGGNLKKNKPFNPWIAILLIIGCIVLGAILAKAFFQYSRSTNGNNNPETNNTKQEKQVISKLDGTKVAESLANRHPLAVIVENHPEARPQSGLDKASLVYEAISEGGITRFMAIFGTQNAEKVGPVRSARTYFVDWTSEYNAYFAHVGGNLDALNMIKTDDILDLDQFGLGELAYWREPDASKAIEHTMYTSTDFLYKAAKNKGYAATNNFQTLNFKKPENTNSTQNIEIDFSTSSYKVNWTYNSATNNYLRNLAEAAHIDGVTGKQLSTDNIIVQSVERWSAPTTINEAGWAMQTIGSGKAKIFIGGKQIDGTWKKTARTSRTMFYDSNGKEIEFAPGKTWYEITPPEVFSKLKIS
jgi:hypothetical protein